MNAAGGLTLFEEKRKLRKAFSLWRYAEIEGVETIEIGRMEEAMVQPSLTGASCSLGAQ